MKRQEEIEDPRRRLLIKALSLGVFSNYMLTGCSSMDALVGKKPEKLPEGKSVYRIDGSASVNGKPATEDTLVKPGDTLETGKNSQFIFVLGGHAMLMRSESRLVITPNDEAVISGLKLESGKILSVSRNTPTQIETPAAMMSTKGTGWYAEAEPDLTYFCTCYGKSEVSAANDPASKTSVQSYHHDKPLYILGNANSGKSILDGPFVNHTDEELALIETIVGRTPPFIFSDDDYAGPRKSY